MLVAFPRIPGAVFAALQAGHAAGDGGGFKLAGVESRDIAQADQAEAAFADVAGRGAAKSERVVFFGYGCTIHRECDSIDCAVSEAGLLDRMTLTRFHPDIDIDLARHAGRR